MIGFRRKTVRPAVALSLPLGAARTGWLEGVHNGWLRGWAYDPDRPSNPARIEISGNGLGPNQVLIADHYRADVQLAGHGQGICGFALPLGPLLPDRIDARWADNGEPLPGSPWQASAKLLPLEGWRGSRMAMFDPPLPGSSALTGIAMDTAEPAQRLELVLVAGNTRFGPVRACRHAAPAWSLSKDTFHGFYLPWDPAVLSNDCEPELRDTRDDAVLLRLNRTWARSTGLA
jgi:hypothetical protein